MRLFSKALNHNKLTRFFKNIRNDLINKHYLNKNVPDTDRFLSQFERGDNLVVSIAYNTPICVEIMLDAWRKYVTETKLVVVDNSSNEAAADHIQQLCLSNCAYIKLPSNPEWHPCRSHALAMNWTYHNLIKKIEPRYFGFLDHDCFPFKDFDLDVVMKGFKLYGEHRISEKSSNIWNLWAGFCFYEYEYLKDLKVNFTHKVELGLDTGGSNWLSVYSKLNDDLLLKATRGDQILVNEDGTTSSFIIIDHFVHFGSGSRSDKGNPLSLKNYKNIFKQLIEY